MDIRTMFFCSCITTPNKLTLVIRIHTEWCNRGYWCNRLSCFVLFVSVRIQPSTRLVRAITSRRTGAEATDIPITGLEQPIAELFSGLKLSTSLASLFLLANRRVEAAEHFIVPHIHRKSQAPFLHEHEVDCFRLGVVLVGCGV